MTLPVPTTGLARLALGGALAILVSACATTPGLSPDGGDTLEKIRSTNTIVLGHREASVPFSFATPGSKEPAGYSVDLCKAVVTSLRNELKRPDLQVKWVSVTVENRIEKVRAGEIDLECGSTTHTLSRRELVDFSALTFVDGGSFLAMLGSNITRVKDLDGKRVAIIPGTSTEKSLADALQQSLAKATFVPVKDHYQGLAALRDGKADAYATDRTILIGLAITAKDAAAFRLSDDLFSYEPYGLMLRRDPAFRLAVDRALARVYRSGDIVGIYKRWFGALGEPSAPLAAMYLLQSLPE